MQKMKIVVCLLALLLFVSVANADSVSVKFLQKTGFAGVGTTNVSVSVSTGESNCWLGCTWIDKNGKEHDMDAIEVTSSSHVFVLPTIKAKKVIIKLWKKKVLRADCNNGRRGGPCEYCKANGYHMEGELASTGWLDATKNIAKP